MNTAQGNNALASITTGTADSAFGDSALNETTTGSANTAVGYFTLKANIDGDHNTAVGESALEANESGDGNTAIGVQSQKLRTSGNHNDSCGSSSLYSQTSGSGNSALGSSAGYTSTTGSNNSFVGFNTGRGITTGSGNTILGAQVVDLASDLEDNIILANGRGFIKARHDGANWSFTGQMFFESNTFLPVGGKQYFGSRAAMFAGTPRIQLSSATVIFSIAVNGVGPSGAEVIVSGYAEADTSRAFTDKVLYTAGGSYQVLGQTGANSPAGRTYSVDGGSLKLAMPYTYYVSATGINQSN